MNITKKQIKTSFVLCLMFLAGFTAVVLGEINVSLDDLPLPSPSQLPIDEQEEAVSFFESQHQSWLAVQNGTTQYEINVRNIIQGEFINDPNHSYTGTLEFKVTPMDNLVNRQGPARVQVRLGNDSYGANFLRDNVFDSEAQSWIWVDGESLPEEQISELKKWSFKTELFFFPLDFMAKSYSDGVWNSKYTEPAEQFFADRGIPRRLSTQEETDNVFGGESQYLFMLSPALVDAHYWFSVDNGELRQVDVILPGGVTKSFRYENYVQKIGEDAKFPQRIVLTQRRGTGSEATGWEYAVDFKNIKLNVDIPPKRFIPPQ
jgi:hypothetical protein